jgi:hypothetical protein
MEPLERREGVSWEWAMGQMRTIMCYWVDVFSYFKLDIFVHLGVGTVFVVMMAVQSIS